MQATENGLSLTKAECNALLEFCCKDKEKPDLQVILFATDGHRSWAYATNGYRAVQADGSADSYAQGGRWLVRRDAIARGKKVLERDQVLRLAFSGASLHRATIEEQGIEVGDLGWPEDTAIAQHALPNTADFPQIKLPHASQETARCVGVDPESFRALMAMSKAAGKIANQYQPRTVDQPAIYQAVGETVWTASVLPKPTEESHGKGKRKKRQQSLDFDGNGKAAEAVGNFVDTLKNNGATVTMESGSGKSVTVGATDKRTAKKKASKRNGSRARA